MNEQPAIDSKMWEAFQYVSGEMSADEATAFEERLSQDVSLCEALVEATTMTVAVSQIEKNVPKADVSLADSRSMNPSPIGRNRKIVAAAIAVCCCLIMGISLYMTSGIDEQPSLAQTISQEGDAEQVVNVWADSFAAEDADAELSASDDLSVPDWMFAAVSLAEINHDQTDSAVDGLVPDDMEL